MTTEEFLKEKFDELNIKYLESYPDDTKGLYKYIRWWIDQEHQKSILYYDHVLLSGLSHTSFRDEVLKVFREVSLLE